MTIRKEHRNQVIAEKILSGQPPSMVAREYSVSASRAREILHAYCWKKDREAYRSFTGSMIHRPTLEQLRSYIDVFLEYNNEISLYSPVTEINEFPMKLINTLIRCELHSVEELLKIELSFLKRYPNIGPIALDKIKLFQQKYRYLTSL